MYSAGGLVIEACVAYKRSSQNRTSPLLNCISAIVRSLDYGSTIGGVFVGWIRPYSYASRKSCARMARCGVVGYILTKQKWQNDHRGLKSLTIGAKTIVAQWSCCRQIGMDVGGEPNPELDAFLR